MKDPTKNFEQEPNLILYCQVCKVNVVGSTYLLNPMTEDEYRIWQGINDQRCSTCNGKYGTFKELTAEYQRETGDDWEKTREFVKKHRKREDFDSALLTEKSKRLKGKDGIINNK